LKIIYDNYYLQMAKEEGRKVQFWTVVALLERSL
jgi:hypothetical protein